MRALTFLTFMFIATSSWTMLPSVIWPAATGGFTSGLTLLERGRRSPPRLLHRINIVSSYLYNFLFYINFISFYNLNLLLRDLNIYTCLIFIFIFFLMIYLIILWTFPLKWLIIVYLITLKITQSITHRTKMCLWITSCMVKITHYLTSITLTTYILYCHNALNIWQSLRDIQNLNYTLQ